VIPRLEITAAEKARPAQSEAAAPPGAPDHAAGGGGADASRLWHSMHFVWYRLPRLQLLKPSTLLDGVFGPTLDQSKGHGVAEDALMLEAFHDGGSGRLFLEATPAVADGSVELSMMQVCATASSYQLYHRVV
jgi:hypothetical protein